MHYTGLPGNLWRASLIVVFIFWVSLGGFPAADFKGATAAIVACRAQKRDPYPTGN